MRQGTRSMADNLSKAGTKLSHQFETSDGVSSNIAALRRQTMNSTQYVDQSMQR